MKIAVIGIGYVGLSLATLLGFHHDVAAVDLNPKRVDAVNHRASPLKEKDLEEALKNPSLSLSASTSYDFCAEADLAIVAVSTDYDPKLSSFDTSNVESAVASIASKNATCPIVIKSTVPVGFTKRLCERYPERTILFSPEFLRESHALEDNKRPSRIVVGYEGKDRDTAGSFAKLLLSCSEDPNTPVLLCSTGEAEGIKLFSNTYLAMRVAFFNELDSYASAKGLDTGSIIRGVCLDPRIQDIYNNPSFGYGGYCLPKDTKQLVANYVDVPQDLISAVVKSNETRKDFIAESIVKEMRERGASSLGIYRLTMKTNSDNFRSSSIQGIIERLEKHGVSMVIYEPVLPEDHYLGVPVSANFEEFIQRSSLIVANRMSEELLPFRKKVFTRDLYSKD